MANRVVGSVPACLPLPSLCGAAAGFQQEFLMIGAQVHAIPRRPPELVTDRVAPLVPAVASLRIEHRHHVDSAGERAALLAALRAPHASVPPKYFYDPLGCALFGAICALPEYYPTRTEASIFRTHRAEIAQVTGAGKQLVDLGAGDCAKSREWLPWLKPSRFLAVDIAGDAIETALGSIASEHPAVELLGIVADFTRGLDLADDLTPAPVTFFYPGSSIGNFDPPDAQVFLASIAWHCAARPDSGLLIGVDMQKDPARLVDAYDDATGVTAAFNRNVLNHVNRVVDADFAPRAFAHRALYDPVRGRIEMHLESLADQVVTLGGTPRGFAAGERIHTENSYKYTPAGFTQMLNSAGFSRVWCWQDGRRDFAVFYAH
jgi:dimethylhistidine N-methyltransferase